METAVVVAMFMALKLFEKLSPAGTWNIESVLNKFMDLAKEISGHNIDIVSWLLRAFIYIWYRRREIT